MRILNLDGHYLVEPFRRLGHDVFWLGHQDACDVVLKNTLSLANLLTILNSNSFTPDLIFWADVCKPPSVIGIETLPAVTIGYSIDQYCNPWHVPYSAAFDLMLLAQRDYLPLFEEANLGNRLQWAPLFCNPFKDIDYERERDIAVSFVGTLQGRINKQRILFMEAFKNEHPLFVTQGEYVPVFNRSRIVLNQSAAGEINFRIFEAMSCGAAVLTEDIENGLKDLFTPGEDILLYPRGDAKHAAHMAQTALSESHLEQIARAGKRKVQSRHSSTARARHVIKCAEELLSTRPTWRQQETSTVQKNIATAYNILAIDHELPLSENHRSMFASIGQRIMIELQK